MEGSSKIEEENTSSNKDESISSSSTKPKKSLVVEPILLSHLRAPPSLIPISTFNQNKLLNDRKDLLEEVPFVSNELEVEETEEDELIEEEIDEYNSNSSSSFLDDSSVSKEGPFVSTSSASVGTGVKLHIHRVSSMKKPIFETAQMPARFNPPQANTENENSQISNLLKAIRSNTSLTIEEVPLETESIDHNIASTGASSDHEIGSTSVFAVPQTKSTSLLKSPTKRGRPPRKFISEPISRSNESNITIENNLGTRRTGRERKPTKHFTLNLTKSRQSTFLPQNQTSKTNLESSKDEDSTTESNPVAIEQEVKPELIEIDSEHRKKRPRGPTGRGRGRPRGSTNSVSRQQGSQRESKNETRNPHQSDSEESNAEKDDEAKTDSLRLLIPTKKTRGSPNKTRGGGSTRGRGGKRLTKAQKIQKAKLRKLLSHRKDALQLFEEETRMSAAGSGLEIKQVQQPTSTVTLDGDQSSNSTSTSLSSKLRKFNKFDIEESRPVTAVSLFEYHWPQDDPHAEIFFLQEQVSEYLGIKSFKRKYPELRRRAVEASERDFLREQKIVSETQCDLGLTALHSSDVLEIMFNDFPEKYDDYRQVIQERREKEYLNRQNKASVTGSSSQQQPPSRDKSAEFMRRILNSASNFNSQLNRDRLENRSFSFDLQTNTLNVQRAKMKILPAQSTKIGYYPVSVLPGQFTDDFKKYSPTELKYLPLNTVLFGPVIENIPFSEESGSDSDASDSSEDSSSSSESDVGKLENGIGIRMDVDKTGLGEIVTCPTVVKDENGMIEDSNGSLTCRTCEGNINKNKDGTYEVLIQCTKCSIANHPSCLELSLDMLPFIKKYNWQCTDCKNCIECSDPADEDKMLFCDLCDRGYHIYCVGLRKVPTGRWHCRICSICYSCGATKPSPDDRGTAEWHHEFKKSDKGVKFYTHSLCVQCHKAFKKGSFCPICLKSHMKFDSKTLVECRTCEKWIHKDCIKKGKEENMLGCFMCEPCEISYRAKLKIPTK